MNDKMFKDELNKLLKKHGPALMRTIPQRFRGVGDGILGQLSQKGYITAKQAAVLVPVLMNAEFHANK